MMGERRTIIWWSTGAASAVAASLALKNNPGAIVARCETDNEDPDNYRFEAEVMRLLGVSVTVLNSDKYSSVWQVWKERRYMAGISGAVCTTEMKIAPRLAFQRPYDVHVFGYTADNNDIARFARLREHYFEMTVSAPLIDAGITKVGALNIVKSWGIKLPRTYAMGFPNANCLQTGCVKATSPNYWALYRREFPSNFEDTARFSRSIGARLTRIKGRRAFIDEIPLDWPVSKPIAPACDFLCAVSERSL